MWNFVCLFLLAAQLFANQDRGRVQLQGLHEHYLASPCDILMRCLFMHWELKIPL